MKVPKANRWLVDAVGALTVVGALVMAAWFGVVESAAAHSTVATLRTEIVASSKAISALNLERSEQAQLLADHERAVLSLGGEKKNATSEGYLRTVSDLARELDVRVIQHRQLGERVYPGLREELFSMHVLGKTASLLQFLAAIEGIDAWADVSYLKLSGGAGDDERRAALTFSMFSEREYAGSAAGAGSGDE